MYTKANMKTLETDTREALGAGIEACGRGVTTLQEALRPDAVLARAVFDGTDEWVNLLRYKLVPHLAGEGCLIAAVAGGTNTGKSTIFNLLQGREVSPVRATAAATRRPLLAGGPGRTDQCLEGMLVPEFAPAPLESPEAVLARETPSERLFVATNPDLPERLVLLDTPDVDSIEKEHWAVADHLRAAGDVIVAVLTGEKYRDERVVAFFREAHASGRVVIPLMNKADAADGFATARQQLAEFRKDIACDSPAFVVPHDFDLAQSYAAPIQALDGGTDLLTYLLDLDVYAIKRRVFDSSVRHLAARIETFLEDVDAVAEVLRSVRDEYRARAERAAEKYDPAPGAAVGGLFHEFVQARRGPFRRAIGSASATVARSAVAVSRVVTRTLFRRATLDPPDLAPSNEEIRSTHRQEIERITRDLAAGYLQSGGNLREPAAHLLQENVQRLDPEAALDAVVKDVLRSENISDEFRKHAQHTIETWWNDHKGRRHALEALDTILAVMPAAIAAPISMYTGGVGVPEAMVVAGPLAEQFVARVIEYQFGDAMFDFLSPWRTEQQRHLADALLQRVTAPVLHGIEAMLEILEGEAVDDLRKGREQCLEALQT